MPLTVTLDDDLAERIASRLAEDETPAEFIAELVSICKIEGDAPPGGVLRMRVASTSPWRGY